MGVILSIQHEYEQKKYLFLETFETLCKPQTASSMIKLS